ncbi:hypothetical protein ATSB10_00280 [Dyella thiooxydans]|uniref:Uncharacterized protein n=2 Tax=Dyella thiooxydans TaxID=445710 RepID=A0A160MY28_9GAMM|nr:hypothetical protein ATSB10_00280 [Dyella thiooxydans]
MILTMLGACRGLPAAPKPHPEHAMETHPMTTPATSDPTRVQLSAQQAMERFLDLIRATRTLQDITPESMHEAMGVDIQSVSPDHYGYGQALPGNWAFSVERKDAGGAGPQVNLSFSPIPGKSASPEGACEPDFAHFADALLGMGFTRHASHGEHSRWLFDYFERPGMRVEVYPRTPRSDRGAPTGPICVDKVLIR